MTSREIVQRTIAFEGPERIAMSLPEPYPDDFVWASIRAARSETIPKSRGGCARAAIAVGPGAESSLSHRELAPPSRDQEPERLICNQTPEF